MSDECKHGHRGFCTACELIRLREELAAVRAEHDAKYERDRAEYFARLGKLTESEAAARRSLEEARGLLRRYLDWFSSPGDGGLDAIDLEARAFLAPPAATPPPADEWVIVAAHLSTEGVAYFWGPKFSGYTRDLDKAGRYTEEQAKSRDVFSERMEVAVPFAEAAAVAHRAVKDDDAHRWHRRRFPGGRDAGAPRNPEKP